MKSKFLFLLCAVVLSTAAAKAAVVEFHIAAGTGSNSWNTENSPVVAKSGDTVRIFNDDNINHRLHTNGEPCAHGPEMVPGDHYDCVLDEAWDPEVDGFLYDHDFGSDTRFWLKATAQ